MMLLKRGIEIGSANMINGLNWLHRWAMWEVTNDKIVCLHASKS